MIFYIQECDENKSHQMPHALLLVTYKFNHNIEKKVILVKETYTGLVKNCYNDSYDISPRNYIGLDCFGFWSFFVTCEKDF